MIRFVDITDGGTPICAFLSTASDMFLSNRDGSDIFSSLEEIEEHPDADRLLGLMPKGFFERVNGMNKYRFHWLLSDKPTEGYGKNVADAFTRLGFGAGATAALDYTEMIS